MKIKRRILNISFFTLILLTVTSSLAAVTYLFVDDLINPPTGSGLELVGNAFAVAYIVLISSAALICQLSVYFNLRYFILCQSKTRLKTFFNVVILIINICLVISALWQGIATTDASGHCFFLVVAVLTLFRMINCIIPYADNASNYG